MAKRKQITLLYRYDENWIGGTYYVLNIIKALNFLRDSDKPELTIAYQSGSSIEEVVSIKYQYINLTPINFNSLGLIKTITNKFSKALIYNNIFKIPLPYNNIYPVDLTIDTKNTSTYYHWITDFQDYHLPHLFTKRDLSGRKRNRVSLYKHKQPIVFSSENAKADFDHLFPDNKNKKVVLPFVSVQNEEYKQLSIEATKSKFNISKRYFIACNQFWKHKNFEVILKAAKILVEKNIDFQIILTGKEHDYRGNGYTEMLKSFVKDNKLDDYISFLGFIDRKEQLLLMKHSIAIIQPSLFEGWSTVVEDAKAINQFIILSDIPLHREQIQKNCIFFNPTDFNYLAELLGRFIDSPPVIVKFDYEDSIRKFALSFLSMFE